MVFGEVIGTRMSVFAFYCFKKAINKIKNMINIPYCCVENLLYLTPTFYDYYTNNLVDRGIGGYSLYITRPLSLLTSVKLALPLCNFRFLNIGECVAFLS